ncbi:MAG: hypothetical protein ACE5GW_02235 [Planctomycetota bacterium]
MRGFAREFRILERALLSGDGETAASSAAALGHLATTGSGLRPQRNLDREGEFRAHLEEIAARAPRIEALARSGSLRSATKDLEGIRRSCVSCHRRFRRGNEETGNFPARWNTISGRVRVLQIDGEERSDRSDVVVFLEGIPAMLDAPVPLRNPSISQKDRRFVPRVLVIRKGTTVDFPNDDTVFHNVFSLSRSKPFDLDIYAQGESRSVTFDAPGLIRIFCNIHPQMACNIVVLNNSAFDVTDQDGRFAIAGIPDGEYILRTWNEFGGETTRKVAMAGSSVHELVLEIQESRRTVKHKNKFGRPYGPKY